MEVIITDEGITDISGDWKDNLKEDARRCYGFTSEEYLERSIPQLVDLILNYVKKYFTLEGFPNPQKTRMLFAHGGVSEYGYVFLDCDKNMERLLLLDDWINRHDGLYDLLIIHACNPGKLQPEAKSSYLMYPRDEFDNHTIRRELFLKNRRTFIISPPKSLMQN